MTVIQILGIVLMAIGVLSFAALLFEDVTTPTIKAGGIDWPAILARLPVRYLPSVVAILIGYALYDPAHFKAIFGS